MEIAKKLSEFVTEVKYPNLPQKTVVFAKELLLKTVSGMVAGSALPSSRKLAKIIKDRKLPGEVGVIGCGFKTSLWEAVLLHAFFAHNTEMEDVYHGHGIDEGNSWDITVIPLLLPLAEKLRLSGKVLLEALVAGLEVHVRTCLPFSGPHLGFALPPTAAMGSAAGAAKAFGLNAKQTASALGFAMSGVSIVEPSMGTDAHFFESALHSLQGIIGAEMAKGGLNSNPALETVFPGLRTDLNKATKDLFKQWVFQKIWIKKYPVCFLIHRQLDALFELIEEYRPTYDQVETIETHISTANLSCQRPDPKTEGELQFSFQHALGVAMLEGDLTLDHINPDAVVNPRFKEARSKVKVIVHPEFPHKELMEFPAKVVIKLKDGREFSKERMVVIGSPEEPLTPEKFKELYRKFTRRVLPEKQTEMTMDLIWNLENLGDIEELIRILAFRYK